MFEASSWGWSGFLKYIGLTGWMSMWLLARTASRMCARCHNASAVRTASRTWTGCRIAGACRGRSRCWQLGHVESSGCGD